MPKKTTAQKPEVRGQTSDLQSRTSAAPPPTGIRDAAGVAKAWGLKLYENRKQRVAQMAAVSAVLARADFPVPKKTKGGFMWDRAAVTAYGMEHIVPDENGRLFEWVEKVEERGSQKPEVRSRKSEAGSQTSDRRPLASAHDLPPAEHPAGDGELFAALTPEEISVANRARLQKNLRIHLGLIAALQPLRGFEIQELVDNKLIPEVELRDSHIIANGGSPFPTNCTLGQLGELYKKRWPEFNINVYKAKINHWQTGTGLPVNAPFHPMPSDSAGRYNVAECFAWFEKWQLPKYRKARTPELPGVPESEEAIDLIALKEREEREQIAFNRWERDKERGEYVHKTTALATGIAAVKKLHQLVKTEDERNLPKQRRDQLAVLLNLKSVALETIAAVVQEFEAWDIALGREITDRREMSMQQAGVKPRQD